MGETTELVRLIVQGGAVGISAVLAVALILLVLNIFQGGKRESKERERLILLVGEVLTRQSDTFKDGMKTLAEETRREYQTGLRTIVDNFTTAMNGTSERMAAVTKAREQTLTAIHADVKTIPAETVRLLGPVLGPLFDEINTLLEQGKNEIAKRLEDLTPTVKTVLSEEMQRYHVTIQHQLDNLTALVSAVQVDIKTVAPSEAEPVMEEHPCSALKSETL